MGQVVRVAAVQLAVGADPAEDLATSRRLVEQAADDGARLVVLAASCGHPASCADADAAREQAVRPGDPWLDAIAEVARRRDVWVVAGATRRADDGRVLASSFLFGDGGALVAVVDEQVPVGGQSPLPTAADAAGPVVDSPLGRLGLCAGADGVVGEAPRSLALRGAQVLCSPLGPSAVFADVAGHLAVRAAENRVFVVAASGAGPSQVVAPDGTVLAVGPREGEAVVLADVEVGLADDKRRPDGSDRLAVRRPTLYDAVPEVSRGRTRPPGADELRVAVLQPWPGAGVASLVHEVAMLAGQADVIVLPELATEPEALVTDLPAAAERGAALRVRLERVLAGSRAVVVTSLVEFGVDGPGHVGIVVSADGVEARGFQLHRWERHGWVATLGTALATVDLPWGRLAVLVGDDATLPEVVRLAAREQADVVAIPFDAQEPWEVAAGLPARSAENGLCVVAATRPGPNGTSLACTLERDATPGGDLPWPPSDGRVGRPVVTAAPDEPGATVVTVHPVAAADRAAAPWGRVGWAADVVDPAGPGPGRPA